MNIKETRRAAYTMLEYCRLLETDPYGRGVRWRLVWMNREGNQHATDCPGWNWIGCDYSIDVRKPEKVWRVEYTKGRIDLLSADFRTREAANASSCDGEFGTVTEIERHGKWVTWEPAANVSEQDAMIASLRSTLEITRDTLVREREQRAAEDRERREQQLASKDLQRAVSDSGVCSWTYDATHDKHDTQCGHLFTFVEGFPREYGFAFCPYCGGRRVESKGD